MKHILTLEIATTLLTTKRKENLLEADHFTAMEDAAAEALAQNEGILSLNGIKTLTNFAVKALSKHQNWLHLNGLIDISNAAAEAFSQHPDRLYLNGLTSISDAAAGALAQKRGSLALNGLVSLSYAAAGALAKYEGWLHLDGLTSLPDTPGQLALAHYLARRHKGTLSLNALTDLPAAIASVLAMHQGHLELNGLTSLSEASAKALAEHQDWLYLKGLSTISEAVAKALGEHKGHWLDLSGLKRLSAAGVKALIRHKGQRIELSGLTGLSDAAARALAGRYQFEVRSSLFEKVFKAGITTKATAETEKDNDAVNNPDTAQLGDLSWSLEERVQSSMHMESIEPEIMDSLRAKTVAESDDDDDGWIAEENEVLNQLPDISEQEREIYRAFMGWGVDGALSYAKLGKRFSITTSAARTICGRVEKSMMDFKRFRPEPFLCTAPAPLEQMPRDEEELRATRDVLFLALMLEGCMRTDWMETTRDKSGKTACRIIPKPQTHAVPGQQFWRAKTLKKLVFEHAFWEVRRLRRRPDGESIKIPRGQVLKFPVRRGSDPLLSSDRWFEHFHSWSGIDDLVVKPGDLLCPLCGPMPPVTVQISSPRETWRMDCGRAFDYYCCSGCLGVFGSSITRMN